MCVIILVTRIPRPPLPIAHICTVQHLLLLKGNINIISLEILKLSGIQPIVASFVGRLLAEGNEKEFSLGIVGGRLL